jgi:hypothetical protein
MATEEEARLAKQRNSPRLLEYPGVSGVSVQKDEEGNYFIALLLSTSDEASISAFPTEVDGCPVRLVHTGSFRKLS